VLDTVCVVLFLHVIVSCERENAVMMAIVGIYCGGFFLG